MGGSFVRYFGFGLLLAVIPAALQAQSMPISTFLSKAEALKKKGPLALFSSDIGLLKSEVQNSATAVRTEQIAAKKAGRKLPYCLPEKASFNSNELLAHFHSIPPAQRGMSVQAGFASLVRKKYPC